MTDRNTMTPFNLPKPVPTVLHPTSPMQRTLQRLKEKKQFMIEEKKETWRPWEEKGKKETFSHGTTIKFPKPVRLNKSNL